MQICEISFGTPEFDAAVDLRYRLLRAPLGMEYLPEQLAEEYATFHLAAFEANGRLVGYLNLVPQNSEAIKMRQVAVEPDCQGKGVGKALVVASEELAVRHGFKEISLHARETAVPFYLRLGYKKVGERFEEVSLPHFKMQKDLGTT